MSKKRKTKEEKIIAELRRQLEKSPDPKPQSNLPKQTSNFNFNSAIPVSPKPTIAYDYSYVKKDLIKTMFLTIVAISAFIVLYWLINKV